MESLRGRVSEFAENPDALAAISAEMIALDQAIKSTKKELDEILPDDLFLGDATDEEIEKHILKHLNLCG